MTTKASNVAWTDEYLVYIDVDVMRCTLSVFLYLSAIISCNICLSDEHLARGEIRCVKSHCNIVADDG